MINFCLGNFISWTNSCLIIFKNIMRFDFSSFYSTINCPNRTTNLFSGFCWRKTVGRDNTFSFKFYIVNFIGASLKYSMAFFAKAYKIVNMVCLNKVVKKFKWFYVMNIERFRFFATIFTLIFCVSESDLFLRPPINPIIIYSTIICGVSFTLVNICIMFCLTFFRTTCWITHRWVIVDRFITYYAILYFSRISKISVLFSGTTLFLINCQTFFRTCFSSVYMAFLNMNCIATDRAS